MTPVKEHIFIAIPTLGWTTSSITGALPQIEAASHHPESRFRFTYEITSEARPADYARNVLVKKFLASDAERLFFIDSDILPPENILELLKVNADIVAGLIPIWQEAGPSLTAYRYDPPMRKWKNTYDSAESVRFVDGAATAAMLIRREVLADARLRYGMEYADFDGSIQALADHEPLPIFREVRKPNGQLAATEDLDFCYRAKALGYSVAVHHGVVCGHVKELNLLRVMDWAAGRFEEMCAEQPSVTEPVATPA